MVFFQITLTRIIQVYIGMGSVGCISLFIFYKILKAERSRLNFNLCAFYIFFAIGTFINLIYAPITNQEILIILHCVTVYLLIFGTIFLLFFNLIFLKSEEVFNINKQLGFMLIFGVILSIIFLIPNGVEINESTGWFPHWSWSLFIFVIIVSIISFGPTYYYSLKIIISIIDG